MPRSRSLFWIYLGLFGLCLASLAWAGKLAVPDVSGIWDLQGTLGTSCNFTTPLPPEFRLPPPQPATFRVVIAQNGLSLSGNFDANQVIGGEPPPVAIFTGSVTEAGRIHLDFSFLFRTDGARFSIDGQVNGTQLTLNLSQNTLPGEPCTFGGPFTGEIRRAAGSPTPTPRPSSSPTPSPTPRPTPTPLPTPTPIPIPLRTIDPRGAIPQITPTNIAVTDTSAVLPTGRTVSAEVVQAVNALTGASNATVTQDAGTGVTTLNVAGQRFSFWPLGVGQTAVSGLTRQDATSGLTVDPATGTATITSAAGIAVTLMGVPPNLQTFLQVLVAAGVSGAQVSPGQFTLTTNTPGLQFSTRLDFGLTSGSGGGAGSYSPNPDGSVTIIYPNGDRQVIFPLFANVQDFMDLVGRLPGVTGITANLNGTLTVATGTRAIRVRPDFSVQGSPIVSKRILLDDPGGPVFDLGDGRRQRFTIVP